MPLLQWIVPDLARRKSNKVQRVFSSGGTAHAVVRTPLPSQVKLKTLRLQGSAIPLALTRDCVRSFAHIGPVLLLPCLLDGLHTAGVVLVFRRETYGNKVPLRKRAPKARATLSPSSSPIMPAVFFLPARVFPPPEKTPLLLCLRCCRDRRCVYGPADLADALSAGGVAGSIPTTSYSRIFLSPSGTLTSMRSFFIFKTTS
jgi:hypothetical protein